MRLELLNKDAVVLTFGYDTGLHRVTSVLGLENPEYAPPPVLDIDGGIGSGRLARWWEHRGIPASRDQLDRLVDALGIESSVVLLEHNMGLSLSDRYWVRRAGSALRWSEVNFFDNDFSDGLGDLTLEPSRPSPAERKVRLMDPNSTAGGNVPKKWTVDRDGVRYLLKTGNKAARQDVYNEAVATELYALALDPSEYVPYSLASEAGAVYCACPNLLEEDEELVPAGDLMLKHENDPDFGTYGSFMRALGESGLDPEYLRTCMAKMFSLDYLMANADRHAGNFGLIRDCVTLEYKRFAPIFDTGYSLWCDKYRLSYDLDYLYSPRPFTGRPSESPERQLRLFDDYRWLPDIDLDAWAARAVEILSSNEWMPASRVEAVAKGIDLNIAGFRRHVERMAGLFPATAPSWLPAAPQETDAVGAPRRAPRRR